jgi:branched-chain amino acid aminotransferase
MSLIPLNERDGLIWFDGKMVPWKEAQVHVLTHGLHYGSGIFEGLRAYGGKIFKLEEHTERLFKSAEILSMKPEFTPEQVNQACLDIMSQNNLGDAYLRPVMWRGAEQMGIAGMKTKTHTAIAAWDWGPAFPADLLANGIVMKTAPWRRPPPECAPVHAKAAGLYMICTLSKRQAEENGYNDCLFLDWRGQISEATAANIFLVIDGEIHTPTPDCFLNGITRLTVIDLAREAGYKIIERAIMPEELAKAQEVFLTGTAYEIVPVAKIDDYEFTVGSVTTTLRQKYNQLVGK